MLSGLGEIEDLNINEAIVIVIEERIAISHREESVSGNARSLILK